MQASNLLPLPTSRRLSLTSRLESPFPLGAYEALKHRVRRSLVQYHSLRLSVDQDPAFPSDFEPASKQKAVLEALAGSRWTLRAFRL